MQKNREGYRGGFWKPGNFRGGGDVLLENNDSSNGNTEVSSIIFNPLSGPLSVQRQCLPIAKHQRQLLYSVEKYPVLIVVGTQTVHMYH